MTLREKILSRAKINWAAYEEYYQSLQFKPLIPTHSSWRHWRFRCADGVFRKYHRTIRTVEDLRRAALELCAIDVYYSTSCWLGPKHKSAGITDGRRGSSYSQADNLLLFAEEYYDIDNKDREQALTDARAVVLQLLKDGKIIEWISHTGSKGYGINIAAQAVGTSNPAQRASVLKAERKVYIEAKLRECQSLDETTTTDPLRVRRLPGTVNSKTGNVCTLLTAKQLFTLKAEEIEALTRSPLCSVKEHSLRTSNPDDESPRLRPSVTAPSEPRPVTKYFLSSKDVSTKNRHVIILRYSHEAHREVNGLRVKYRLGNVWSFKTEDEYWYTTETTWQRSRALKIIKASHATNKTTMTRFGEAYLPLDIQGVGKILGRTNAPISEAHVAAYNSLATGDNCLWNTTKKKIRITMQVIK